MKYLRGVFVATLACAALMLSMNAPVTAGPDTPNAIEKYDGPELVFHKSADKALVVSYRGELVDYDRQDVLALVLNNDTQLNAQVVKAMRRFEQHGTFMSAASHARVAEAAVINYYKQRYSRNGRQSTTRTRASATVCSCGCGKSNCNCGL